MGAPRLSLKVINFWCGPGGGKSTTAACLFYLMKRDGMSVELVTEYAKDLTYAHDWNRLSHSPSVLAEQDYRLRRLDKRSEWAITDSPLPLSIAYMAPEYNFWLDWAAWQAFDRYQNYNVLVRRVKPYQTQGRNQTEDEAKAIDKVVEGLFWKAKGHATQVDGDSWAAKEVYQKVLNNGFA